MPRAKAKEDNSQTEALPQPVPEVQLNEAESFKVGEMVTIDYPKGNGKITVPCLVAGIREIQQPKKNEKGEVVTESKVFQTSSGEVKRVVPLYEAIERYDLKLFHPDFQEVLTLKDKVASELTKL